MNPLHNFLDWARSWLNADLIQFIVNDYDFGFAKMSPIMFITISGILLYLVIAVVRWII